MQKRIWIVIAIIACSLSLSAQRYYNDPSERKEQPQAPPQEEYGKGFNINHLFTGGDFGLGFTSYSFYVGVSPEIGYSFNRFLDMGVVTNFNYSSYHNDPNYGYDYQHIFNYGVGGFVRFYPLPFLFLQVRPEYNWIHTQVKYNNGTDSYTAGAPSILAGIGYGTRIVGRSSFHLSINFDLLNDPNSPYRYYGDVIPVIKAGFNIYFKPKNSGY